MRPFLLGLVLIFTLNVVAQHTVKYKLAVGDTFVVTQEANQLIIQDLNGVEQVIDNLLLGKMQFQVIETNAETITLTMMFKQLKMNISSPTLGELTNVDSADENATDITARMFKGMMDVPVTIVMTHYGKINSVTGGDKLITSMFKAVDITDPEMIEISKGQMEKQFGSDALSQSLEQMTNFYPTEKVTIGGSWKNSYSGNMTAQNTWVLEAYDEKSIKIKGSAKTIMSNIDENIIMTLNGTQNTIITADSQTGLPMEMVVEDHNEGETLFQQQNMSIPTVITSKITYKISK